MKTFIEKPFMNTEYVKHPASGMGSRSEGRRKRRSGSEAGFPVTSPECFNMRGPGAKKANVLRLNPAP